MPRSRKSRRNPKPPKEVASHNKDQNASKDEPEIQSIRTSSQAELTTETEVSQSEDTVAPQELSADDGVSNYVEESVSNDVEESVPNDGEENEPAVEQEDPNITVVCQDYTSRCHQQPVEAAATGETRILGAKVDVHAWREEEKGGHNLNPLYLQGRHFDRRHVQPYWENIDQVGFNGEPFELRTCGDFRRMNLIPVRPFNKQEKQFVKGERRWGFGVENREEAGQNLDDIYLRITEKPVLGYQFIDEDTLKPLFVYEQYHYAVMAGTGNTGAVPVHLEGMVYERSKIESGKRVFGRVKRWDGKIPVKSKQNDFQETSSDLTNQGNLSDTHKETVQRDIKIAKILKREGISDYNTIHVVNPKSAVGETKQLELQNQYDKQQRASAAAEKAFAAREARKQAIASAQSNVGPAVKPKSRKKTRAKKVAAKSQNGRDDDIVLDEAVKASFIQTFTDRYQDGYFMGCVACFFYWLFIDQGFTDELQTFFHNPYDSSVIFREIIRTNHLPLKLYDVCKLGMAARELSQALEKKKDKYVTYVQKLTLDYFIRPYDPSCQPTPFVLALEYAKEAKQILSLSENEIPKFLQGFVKANLCSANCREWLRSDPIEGYLHQLIEKQDCIQLLFSTAVEFIDEFPTVLKEITTKDYDGLQKMCACFSNFGSSANDFSEKLNANKLEHIYSDFIRKCKREDASDFETGTDL